MDEKMMDDMNERMNERMNKDMNDRMNKMYKKNEKMYNDIKYKKNMFDGNECDPIWGLGMDDIHEDDPLKKYKRETADAKEDYEEESARLKREYEIETNRQKREYEIDSARQKREYEIELAAHLKKMEEDAEAKMKEEEDAEVKMSDEERAKMSDKFWGKNEEEPSRFNHDKRRYDEWGNKYCNGGGYYTWGSRKTHNGSHGYYDPNTGNHHSPNSDNPFGEQFRGSEWDDIHEKFKEAFKGFSGFNDGPSEKIQKALKVLGIINTDTNETIKYKYRELVRKWHPDRWCQQPLKNQKIAENNLKVINNHYDIIKGYKRIQ